MLSYDDYRLKLLMGISVPYELAPGLSVFAIYHLRLQYAGRSSCDRIAAVFQIPRNVFGYFPMLWTYGAKCKRSYIHDITNTYSMWTH